MKKIHLALLIAAAITAITSVYSLAAINQTYRINFEWLSTYTNTYSAEKRDVTRDEWHLDNPEATVKCLVFQDIKARQIELEMEEFMGEAMQDTERGQYLFVLCSLGQVASPEYRVKIADIAQRGDVVEVVVSMNSPEKTSEKTSEKTMEKPAESAYSYSVSDIVRIDKDAFPIKGKLLFTFKNQDGTTLGEQYYDVR